MNRIDKELIIKRYRERLAKYGQSMGTLASGSKERQLILLFLPEEHTQEISEILDSCFGKKFLLKMSPDEKQSYLEVI